MIREGAMPDSAPQDPSTLPLHGLDTEGGQRRQVSIPSGSQSGKYIVWPSVVYKGLVKSKLKAFICFSRSYLLLAI